MTKLILDRVLNSCAAYNEQTAIIAGDATLTYGDLGREIASAATVLSEHLGAPYDRLGIYAPNSASYIIAYYAALMAGYVPFLIDPALGQRDLRSISASCGLLAILHPAGLAKELPDATCVRDVAVGQLALSVLKCGERDRPALHPQTGTCRFTSGTTGTPKCLEFSHEAVLSAAENWRDGTAMAADENTLCLSTFANGLAFNTSLLATFISGARLTLYDGMLNSGRVCQLVKAGAITRLIAFPLVYKILVETVNSDPGALRSLRIAASAGAPLAPELQEAFETRYQTPLANYYGIAEVGPCTFRRSEASAGLGSALPGVELRCAGTPNAPQDIYVRTASMATRYLNAPELLGARTTADGFYHSGDLGYVEDQCLFIAGRIDQQMNLAGRKIDPQEIESFAASITGVKDAAVFADQTANGDTFIHLAVAGAPNLDLRHISQSCRDALTSYKVPSRVSRVDEIPRSSSGKVRLSALFEKIQSYQRLESAE